MLWNTWRSKLSTASKKCNRSIVLWKNVKYANHRQNHSWRSRVPTIRIHVSLVHSAMILPKVRVVANVPVDTWVTDIAVTVDVLVTSDLASKGYDVTTPYKDIDVVLARMDMKETVNSAWDDQDANIIPVIMVSDFHCSNTPVRFRITECWIIFYY